MSRSVVALVCLGALTLVPSTAAIAAGEIEASSDGVDWGPGLAAPLFDGVSLVPLTRSSASFQLRNSGTEDGFLRVVVQDVSSSSAVFLNALSIALTVDGAAGPATPISTASPCRVIFEGELGANEVVPVVATVALADLSGTQGQGATAQFRIGVELTDTAFGDLLPTDCGSPDTVIEITPFDNRVATIVGLGVAPNTWQLYEEYLLLVLLAALAFGVGAQWVVATWLRRRDEDDLQEQRYREDLA